MSLLRALASGAGGAAALTALHEGGRRTLRHPPRMDVYGKRTLRRAGVPLRGRDLERATLASDLVSNALYYALAAAGAPARAPWRGLLLGLAAGAGALVLPGPLGLGRRPSRARRSTAALTVAWYAAGGLVAGLLARALTAAAGETPRRPARWEPFPPTTGLREQPATR